MNINSANELRSLFLKFFESKGHKVIPSASVIPRTIPPCCSPPRACTRWCPT